MVIPAGKIVYVNGHTYRPGDVLPDDTAIKIGLLVVEPAVEFVGYSIETTTLSQVHSGKYETYSKPSKKRDKY
jgi:hypothetical protein